MGYLMCSFFLVVLILLYINVGRPEAASSATLGGRLRPAPIVVEPILVDGKPILGKMKHIK